MASSQLEDVINAALKNGDVHGLEEFLQRDSLDETLMKCSQQFLIKLDKLVNKSFDQKDPKAASLVYVALSKYGKNVKLPAGGEGFSGLMTQGLIKKMMHWFEKSRQMWIQCGPQWDKPMFTLSEDLLNALMVVHESSKEGALGITEAFLYPVGQLVVDPRIYISIQKEAIRKFNYFLDTIPAELKKDRKLLTSQEASDIMMKLAGKILEGGDYDYQSSLMEALCRMATANQRKELAYRWFSMGHVASAFANIRDSEFETASRKFLNMVNGIQGDGRRVYSYPCLEVYLDSYELLMPVDEKLEEFWIDFNLGSSSISFYFTLADEESKEAHWETLSISESDVSTYTVTELGKRKILQVNMSEVVVVGSVEGSKLTIHFSSSLDILQAAHNVYGLNKDKISSVKKSTIEESSTQFVPESQVSLSGSERTTLPYPFAGQSMHSQVTPAKMRISESISFICGSAGRTVLSGRPSGKNKQFLEKVHSSAANSKSSCFSATLGRTNGFDFRVQCDTSNIASEQTIEKHTNQFKKNISVTEAIALVTEEGRLKFQEQDVVLDTQPRAGRNKFSSLSKMSVSEMLMIPNQKKDSLPRPEPRSSVAETQEHQLSSAQKWSVSDSTPVRLKRLHVDLTDRLQKVLDEQNREPVPEKEAVAPKKNAREESEDKSSGKEDVLSISIPKVQQGQRQGRAKQKSKGQIPLALKDPVNTTSIKEKTSSTVMDQSKKAPSSKDKSESDATGSMVQLISSHYAVKPKSTGKDKASNKVPNGSNPRLVIRPTINMMWSSTFKTNVCEGPSHNKATEKSTWQKKDVFAFSLDSPLKIRGVNKTLTDSSNQMQSDINGSSSCLVSTKRGQPEPKSKRHVKKHLFSDTDPDDAKTDYSWLRESSRKPKPKVTKYSRQAPIKAAAVEPQTSGDSSDLRPPPPSAAVNGSKPNKKNTHLKNEMNRPKKSVGAAAAAAFSKGPTAAKRPKRAAARSTKNYKEPDTDDSHSESEKAPPPKDTYLSACEPLKTDLKNNNEREVANTKRTNCVNHKLNKYISKECKDVYEVTNLNKSKIPPVQEKRISPQHSWVMGRTCLSPSPVGIIEKMRCFIETLKDDKRSVPTLDVSCSPLCSLQGTPLLASPNPCCQEVPSPIPLLHKPLSTVSSKAKGKTSSFHSTNRKHSSSKKQSIPSPTPPGGHTPALSPSFGFNATEENLFSAPQSPLSLPTEPLLTSTAIEQVKPQVPSPSQSPYPKDSDYGQRFAFAKKLPVFKASLSQSSSKSSVVTGRIKESPSPPQNVSPKIEKTPSSDQDRELQKQPHVSGPCRKRHVSYSSSSEDENKEREKRSKLRAQHSTRMKPRKLFKSFTEVSAVKEVDEIRTHTSSTSCQAEEADGDVDYDDNAEPLEDAGQPNKLCQQFNFDLKKKFQNRYEMMDAYNKQSLKTVQQYVCAINLQVTKYRTQRLEQVQKVLLEEIHKLEQDDTELKSMEKELTMHWKKQTSHFHAHQKQETIRNETLKRTLESYMCHNFEHEERLFTSQMGLMRKDMKSVQDRLLSEMQEKELQSVKRGLHSLFFP
ncbi:synaptonemal complex protein 2 isoform X2 [Gouania willdenowi]|uniref:synaptonemal complex protein 2 isoform X2 n=1 Tax=Gouania willdenowi TaxID=441366 RepID=UPI0010548469|nr:synaptonemal complex protein 2 isoform X2 [Gouania willdenowi]